MHRNVPNPPVGVMNQPWLPAGGDCEPEARRPDEQIDQPVSRATDYRTSNFPGRLRLGRNFGHLGGSPHVCPQRPC